MCKLQKLWNKTCKKVETELQLDKEDDAIMKLWDKLKNASTINKVFIFAIILLIVISIIGGIYILTRNNNIENIDPGIAKNKIVQEVAQNIPKEDAEENLIEQMDSIEDKSIQTEDNQESQVNKVNIKTENTTSHSTDVSQVMGNNKGESVVETKPQENIQNTESNNPIANNENKEETKENAQDNTEDEKNNEKVEEESKEEVKQETTEETKQENVETPKETGEKYIQNDEMINKIKQVIENNVTEDMSMYGYEIVVDSSIKELTNQFTFTETRVKNALRFKFGTIRIYAEDYYKDGQYIMTECYII